MTDPLVIVQKIQRILKNSQQSISETMMSGGVDNMEKYKYML